MPDGLRRIRKPASLSESSAFAIISSSSSGNSSRSSSWLKRLPATAAARATSRAGPSASSLRLEHAFEHGGMTARGGLRQPVCRGGGVFSHPLADLFDEQRHAAGHALHRFEQRPARRGWLALRPHGGDRQPGFLAVERPN